MSTAFRLVPLRLGDLFFFTQNNGDINNKRMCNTFEYGRSLNNMLVERFTLAFEASICVSVCEKRKFVCDLCNCMRF